MASERSSCALVATGTVAGELSPVRTGIRLPRPRGFAVAHTEGKAPGHGPGEPGDVPAGSVLLVDDDADVRQVIRLYLERVGGFEVVGEAADGRQGIDFAAEMQPDVILLDVMMPGMSGHEAVPELLRVAPQAMIVMLSALSAGDHEDRALSAGAFAYIEKSTLDIGLGEQVSDLLVRFRHALTGRTAWAPERRPR